MGGGVGGLWGFLSAETKFILSAFSSLSSFPIPASTYAYLLAIYIVIDSHMSFSFLFFFLMHGCWQLKEHFEITVNIVKQGYWSCLM